jgi:D-alanine-D-alanine ligase
MSDRTPPAGAKPRVAVVFGGRSTEHGVSCLSAAGVLAQLDRSRFEVVPVGITRAGGWVLGSGDPVELGVRAGRLASVESGTPLVLPADPTRGELVHLEPGERAAVLSGVDVVFPLLHGAFGEDGTIQGLLELAGVPYVGAGVLASAVAMDKEFTKKLLVSAALPVVDAVVLRRGESDVDAAARDRLGLPAFVKPARAGSSIGISRITGWDQLPAAVDLARQTDPKVLVEAAALGREVECGVLEFPDGRIEASLPAEVRLVGENVTWYDFDAKYLDDVCEFDIPAKLDDAVADRLRAMAVEAFRALDCQGLARVDFFVGADGSLTVNEVNTMPGFTPVSMFPRMWTVTGVDYSTLLTTLIETAIARGTGLR